MVCNSGTSLVPTIDGKIHHFYLVGVYDALLVMQDAETKTVWDHITGEAKYGPLVGRALDPLSNLLQMSVSEALKMDPAVRVAISDKAYVAGGRRFGTEDGFRREGWRPGQFDVANIGNATMSEGFVNTIAAEDLDRLDRRRPRMDMGLGVWIGTTARYYPMERIRQQGEAFIDRLGGRTVLIYVSPESNTPNALFVTARSATMQGDEVRLDDGSRVQAGVLIDAREERRMPERPPQMFTRWYGFSLTYPGCEIFGESATP